MCIRDRGSVLLQLRLDVDEEALGLFRAVREDDDVVLVAVDGGVQVVLESEGRALGVATRRFDRTAAPIRAADPLGEMCIRDRYATASSKVMSLRLKSAVNSSILNHPPLKIGVEHNLLQQLLDLGDIHRGVEDVYKRQVDEILLAFRVEQEINPPSG